MNFQEAISALKEGKKVRRIGWTQQVYLKCRKSFSNAVCYYSINKENSRGGKADYDFDDFGATDWEIYCKEHVFGDNIPSVCANCGIENKIEDKKESLSDKMWNEPTFPLQPVYREADVKEKVQNAERRLKADINLEMGGIDIFKIKEIIEKVFREEFGELSGEK